MLITTSDELQNSLKTQKTIVIRNGTYKNFQCSIKSFGTKSNPIVIKAETPNQVYFKGNSYFDVDGAYITFEGFNFKECNVEYNFKLKGEGCRVTKCKFYNYIDHFEYLIYISGKNHRVDNCEFRNIAYDGLCIFLHRGDTSENYLVIENNLFKDRKEVAEMANGLEIIRIGTSHQSLSSSKSVIINNTFEQCDGEIETISVKACDNIVMNNTLKNCKGSITLRHGNGNIVHRNLIDQQNKPRCAGIRVVGENQLVSENVVMNVNEDSANRTAINVVAGQENPALNGYHNVKNTTIKDNQIIDCKVGFAIGVKVKSNCIKKPSNLVIKDNIYLGPCGFNKSSASQYNNNASYSGNVFYTNDLGKVSSKGISRKSPKSFGGANLFECGTGKVNVSGTNKQKYDKLKALV